MRPRLVEWQSVASQGASVPTPPPARNHAPQSNVRRRLQPRSRDERSIAVSAAHTVRSEAHDESVNPPEQEREKCGEAQADNRLEARTSIHRQSQPFAGAHDGQPTDPRNLVDRVPDGPRPRRESSECCPTRLLANRIDTRRNAVEEAWEGTMAAPCHQTRTRCADILQSCNVVHHPSPHAIKESELHVQNVQKIQNRK